MRVASNERIQRLDLDEIRRNHPLPEVAGALVPLKRRGNELVACCPFHPDKSPSFTIFDGGARFHCFGCGASGDVLDFIQRAHGVGLREAADMLTGGNLPSVHVAPPPSDDGGDRIEEARAIWRAAVRISGTLAETYLRARSLHLPLPECLRFTSLRYGKSGPEHPCLVAAVASPDHGFAGIQRIYLRPDGKGKADVPKPKLNLGRVSGCAVRLAPPARSIVIAEGIEDALSLIQVLGKAAWATCGTSNLGKVQFPPGQSEVVIGADNDPAGEEAARKAAHAYSERGIRVRIIRPLPGFKDWNQEIQERGRS